MYVIYTSKIPFFERYRVNNVIFIYNAKIFIKKLLFSRNYGHGKKILNNGKFNLKNV